MAVIIRESAFHPYQELAVYERQMGESAGKFGAATIFIGSMRDFNLGDAVTHMALEYYPGMTENRLEKILEEAQVRWDLIDALVIHRVGDIHPGDSIVLVAVWTPHRGAAFDSCRYIIEALKHSAPFWKKETLNQGERWVESNTEA